MSEFIEWLEGLNKKDTKVRAVLRRGLAFDPGCYPPAFPYVEPFVRNEGNGWRREMYYLVAGLWAAHWRDGRTEKAMPLGTACARHRAAGGSGSTEQRFVSLLDADEAQLPHRLRQMVALLKEEPIDFGALLEGLLFWNDRRKRTQQAWARDFYRTLDNAAGAELSSEQQENSK